MWVSIVHYLLGFRLGLWIGNYFAHIGKIDFAVVGNIAYLFTAWGERHRVHPSIARDRDEILTICVHIFKWSSSLKINVFVIAWGDLNWSVKWTGDCYSAGSRIKPGTNYWSFMNWFIWWFADWMGYPEIVLLKISSNVYASWTCCDNEFVSSSIPVSIQICSLLFDHTHLWKEIFAILLPDDHTSIGRCTY